MGGAESYLDELKQLCKNRGLCVARAGEIGAGLRAACGVNPGTLSADMVREVGEVLRRQTQELGWEQRVAALGALGLDGPQTQFLKDREDWVAARLERNVRTARRRVREGLAELASLLDSDRPSAPDASAAWRTERLRVLLALDHPQAEMFMFRHVIAEAELLEELELPITLTAESSSGSRDNDMSVDVFSGGTLVRRTQETNERVSLALRPPKSLYRGDLHEIALRLRVSRMAPFYVCVPKGPCAEFDLTIRFGERSPATVGLLRKVFQDDLRDATVTGEPLRPDAAGEVRANFRGLEPGFAYGIRWPAASSGQVG